MTTHTPSWVYNEVVFGSEMIGDNLGFVYLITNIKTQRQYIGKKLFWKPKYNVVKGKRKKTMVESDWKNYWSSSTPLHKDIEMYGVESYTREILHLCKSKGNLSYMELDEQMKHRVLENPDKYFNGIIQCRINAKHLKLDTLRIDSMI